MFTNIKSAGTSNNKPENLLTSDTKLVDLKVERESGDEVWQSEIHLCTDHVIKVELAVGHDVLQHAVCNTNCSKGTHLASHAKTTELSQNRNSDNRNGSIIKLEVEAMSTVREEQTEELYAEHKIKDEMVIGPVVLQAVTYMMEENSKPLPKKPRLDTQDKTTEPDNTSKETRTEMNSEEMTPNKNTESLDTKPIENVKNKIPTKTSIPRDNTQKNIRNDKNNETTNNVFQCNVKQYDKKADLALDKTKRDIYFKCNECTYQSVTLCSLERHLKLHDKNRRFVCDVCGNRYTENKHLQEHLRNVHSGEKIHKCGVCDYKTNNIHRLNTHLRMHSGEKPYSCSLCEYKSYDKSHLKTHSRIHTGEKPYSCSQCAYKCNRKCDLIKHSRIHTGEKPYSCSECDYKCNLKSHLKTHSQIHTGEKPYSCSQCIYKCKRKCDLKTHSRTHTGEKPYSCLECEYKCSQKSNLKSHSRIHTGEKPYSCYECNYKCTQAGRLKHHLRTHRKHPASHARTSEPSQTRNSNNRNVSIIKLEAEAVPAVREEPTDELYADHEIKDEMVIVPVVLQAVTYMTEEYGEALPKKLRLDTQDKTTKPDNSAKETRKETNTEEITSRDCNENTEPSDTKQMENVKNKIITTTSKPRNNTQKNIRNDKNNKTTKNVFQCNVCAKQYDKKPDLAQHIESHDKTKRDIYFKCKECTYQSVTLCSLERHLELHDKSRRFVCDVCGNRYTKNKHLQVHLRNVHSNEKIHECGICDYKTNYIHHLNTHSRIHSGEPLPKKPRLDTQNKNTEPENTVNGDKETRTETNTEEIIPKECNENTDSSGTKPMEKVKNKIPTKTSKPRNNTQKNIKYDKNNKNTKNVFQCSVCAKQYDKKPDLAQHIKSHDKTKRDIYFKCKECTYQSVTQCSLERHLKLHDKSRRFVCDVCGYRYTENKHLQEHIRNVHSGEKIHECGICGYKTSYISGLNTHLRIHSGEKPYFCSLCEYECNQKIHLKIHSLVHTDEKPYSCSVCEYKSNRKSDLKIHSRIHTGEKPYSCPLCEYECNRKSRLKTHSRIHSGEKPYSCSECNFKCNHSSNLNKHFRTHSK